MELPESAPRMIRETTQKAEDPKKALSFLVRLATELAAVLSVDELVDGTLNLLDEEVGFDSSTVGLIDEPRRDTITLVGAVGVRRDYKGLIVPRGRSLNWAVVDSMRPLYVPDMLVDPRVYRLHEGVRSGIYAPMIVRGRVIGVLSAHSGVVNGFGAEDLDLLTLVARYLAGPLEVTRVYEQLRELAATDSLTGLFSRRSIMERFATEVSRGRRDGTKLTAAIVDADDFKAVNDTLGHQVGDAVLVQVAQALKRSVRAHDIPGRLGGDEFILLFPNTGGAEAESVLRRLQQIETAVAGISRPIVVALSWGLATWPDEADSVDGLMAVADPRLYAMKKTRAAERGEPQTSSESELPGPGGVSHLTS